MTGVIPALWRGAQSWRLPHHQRRPIALRPVQVHLACTRAASTTPARADDSSLSALQNFAIVTHHPASTVCLRNHPISNPDTHPNRKLQSIHCAFPTADHPSRLKGSYSLPFTQRNFQFRGTSAASCFSPSALQIGWPETMLFCINL